MNENSSEESTRRMIEEKSEEQRARGSPEEARSCKGYLYYSSTVKSKSHNPRCIGFPRTFRRVPDSVVGQSEAKATKEGVNLADFYYGCLGYSVYVTEKDSSAMKQHAKTQLPICTGLEMVAVRRAASPNTSSATAHVRNTHDDRELPPRQTHRPTPAAATGDGFLTRFTRNANLVASGVVKNMKRVGNYVKETADDVLAPYRKRPK